MKSIPLTIQDGKYRRAEPEHATHLALCFPGPSHIIILPVILRGSRDEAHAWTWNGSIDAPTVKPSVLTQGCSHMPPHQKFRCHSWVNDGKAIFLSDSDHEFTGQTLDMLDVPEDYFQHHFG